MRINIEPGIRVGTDGWVDANQTWEYASADDPTFTITVPSGATSKYSAGMRIKLTQTTTKYFIITKVADTVLTVYGGTDYDLADAAITSPYYSCVKAPQGFPLDPEKWEIKVVSTTSVNESGPTAGTWYNIGTNSIDIPIGIWDIKYKSGGLRMLETDLKQRLYVTLSTANNSESNDEYTVCDYGLGDTAGLGYVGGDLTHQFPLSLATKDTYYLNFMAQTAGATEINLRASESTLIIRATCAYL